MQEKEKNELFRELDELRKEISDLKISLNQTDEQKEKWFRSKEDFSNRIKGLIWDIREKRTKRDSLTEEVKKGKEKRKELNDRIQGKISEIKKLNSQERDFIKKHHIKGDPSGIREDIDRLESRIETEVISFEKEKEVMKRIKELKKKLEETKGLNDLLGKKSNMSREIDMLKNEAKDIHKKIQDTARESQVNHESLILNSKEIDELKKKEEEAFQKFVEFKKKFNEINDKLKDRLMEMNRIRGQLDAYRTEGRKKRKEKEEKLLKGREEIVKEKMRKGEKLTTEDLLIFQNLKE